ncbi:MAG: DUF2339 domain-containing protein [Verrucomicrobia bacterium]|nr:DUF2339 domain-containing protein [Verrucomicrobiota bacterium]
MQLLILCVLALVAVTVWLVSKVLALAGDAEESRSRLDRAEAELYRLKERLVASEMKPAEAPRAVTPATKTPVPPSAEPALAAPPPLPPAAQAQQEEPVLVRFPTQPSEAPPLLATEPVFSPVEPEKPRFAAPAIDWEQFMGVKLFAWIGGLALFLGVAFFVKYSFDNDLVPRELRVALGFLAGIGLVVGGVFLKRKEYEVTSQTLCATGTVILYATAFACHAIYHFPFFGVVPTFALMVLITAAAFLLAVRMTAQVVAVLGMLGGFLTPILIRSGHDNPLGLFGYVALLDLGLIAVALHRRWNYLALLGAVCTAAMQLLWAEKFFEVGKVSIALAVFLGFDVLFLAAYWLPQRRARATFWNSAASVLMSAVTLGFTFYLLSFSDLGKQPWTILGFLLGADLCLLALPLCDTKLHPAHLAAGGVSFLVLAVWMLGHLTAPLLNWALAASLVFAVLHTVFPIVLERRRPGVTPVWWGHFFPPLALLLVMLPMARLTELTWFLWPCVLLIDLLAILLAALTASLLAILAVLFLTVVATAVWLAHVPAVVADLPEMLVVIGGFGVFFFIVGVFAGKKVFGSIGEALGARQPPASGLDLLGLQLPPEVARAQIPAFSAILPFLLLIMVTQRLDLAGPSAVFGLAMLMVVLLLGVTRMFNLDALAAVGLACALALEHVWHQLRFKPETAGLSLGWYLAFYAVFTAFPFVFRRTFEGRTVAWAVAALSGPAHFYLVHNLVKRAWPNAYMGLLPALFAVPALACLVMLVKQLPAGSPKRAALLAWFGGVTLFFITLIFPIQFDRQWITIGWALEGAAVLWLFTRLDHPGLRITGVGLLIAAFARLALNPAVLSYHARAVTPIWNWYLYAYGIATLCLFAGAWFLRPPRHELFKSNAAAVLTGLGTVLGFLLLNIEIADYFTLAGRATLTFEFTGHFGRDMTYSIAWALFALTLLIAGLWKQVRAARYAGLGLLMVTLAKLFFHDLAQLQQLYRIGAFIGVAVIAILASFLYQRFFAIAKLQSDASHETTK